nr:retrovirus-related Pol polyprotein from transposon TNT 1-94 [Tanacetum cinerariifolium]
QVPRNIIKALGGKGRRKEKISSKEVFFTKADESSSTLAPEITSDSDSECDSQEPLPPLPKLIGETPYGTSKSLISLSDLTLNMADLTLDTPEPKKTRPPTKVSPTYVIKKKTENTPAGSKPFFDKKADSSTKKLLLTLMEEVKGLKRQIEIPSGTPPSSTQSSCSKSSKQKTWFGPYSGCSRHMIWIKQYLHRYLKESGLKVVFGDDSSGDTEGYDSVNCNGITFTRVAYVNGLKHNLINISQLCDANYKLLFTKTQGTIYNQNNEVILIALRRRDVYVIDMSSFNKESNACFFAKASPSVSWDHLGKFDEKANDGFFLSYSPVAKAFRVFNIRRQEIEEAVHVTFSEDDEAISQSSTEGDAINFNENRSFLDDEFLEPRSEVTQCPGNTEYFPYIITYENITLSESPILQEYVIFKDPFEFTEADNTQLSVNLIKQNQLIFWNQQNLKLISSN